MRQVGYMVEVIGRWRTQCRPRSSKAALETSAYYLETPQLGLKPKRGMGLGMDTLFP